MEVKWRSRARLQQPVKDGVATSSADAHRVRKPPLDKRGGGRKTLVERGEKRVVHVPAMAAYLRRLPELPDLSRSNGGQTEV